MLASCSRRVFRSFTSSLTSISPIMVSWADTARLCCMCSAMTFLMPFSGIVVLTVFPSSPLTPAPSPPALRWPCRPALVRLSRRRLSPLRNGPLDVFSDDPAARPGARDTGDVYRLLLGHLAGQRRDADALRPVDSARRGAGRAGGARP